jgi:hypothetical protein
MRLGQSTQQGVLPLAFRCCLHALAGVTLTCQWQRERSLKPNLLLGVPSVAKFPSASTKCEVHR